MKAIDTDSQERGGELSCPHCLGRVPNGARVCRGCHAEVEYGPRASFFLWPIGVAIFLGTIARLKLRSFSYADEVAFAIGLLVFVMGSFLIVKSCENRIVFKRFYRR